MVLKGAAANKRELAQALRNRPSVVHVAAHMLFPPRQAGSGLLALSLQASQIELLTDTETAGMRANRRDFFIHSTPAQAQVLRAQLAGLRNEDERALG